ncbi:hypothetical protein [Escherichia coli]|uniref:hypothetical protein n=1 Tax=Escherichia coli TaxID=562 RepID=UPI002076FE2D|nr:hypothetical protein [Escherichia coli]
MNISDIRAGLRTLVESEKTTYAQIARESGVAAGTLSAFVNNKYNGDNERVAQTLERWLENYHRAAELPEPPRFVETRTARQIWTSMRFASLTESISVIRRRILILLAVMKVRSTSWMVSGITR